MQVTAAGSGEAGIESFDRTIHDVVLCDLNMPGVGGLKVLERLREMSREAPFIVLTAHGTVAQAVEAIKHGRNT